MARNRLIYFIMILAWTIALSGMSGCIGKVRWVERKGGQPQTDNWIPICPDCKQVVDYDSLQCKNPNCRILLSWSDKIIYADKLYLEDQPLDPPPKTDSAAPGNQSPPQQKQQPAAPAPSSPKENKQDDADEYLWSDDASAEKKPSQAPAGKDPAEKDKDKQSPTQEQKKTKSEEDSTQDTGWDFENDFE